jgi:hypothetical protein
VHLILLTSWVFGCGFVRAGGKAIGAAVVAQFTPFVMVEIPAEILKAGGAGYELWAFRRIQQNMVAVVLFVLVEVRC